MTRTVALLSLSLVALGGCATNAADVASTEDPLMSAPAREHIYTAGAMQSVEGGAPLDQSASIVYWSHGVHRAVAEQLRARAGVPLRIDVRADTQNVSTWLFDASLTYVAPFEFIHGESHHHAELTTTPAADTTLYVVVVPGDYVDGTKLDFTVKDLTPAPPAPPPTTPPPALASLLDDQCPGAPIAAAEWSSMLAALPPLYERRWTRYPDPTSTASDGLSAWSTIASEFAIAKIVSDHPGGDVVLVDDVDGSIGELGDGCVYGVHVNVPFLPVFDAAAGVRAGAPTGDPWGTAAFYEEYHDQPNGPDGRCYTTTYGLGTPERNAFRHEVDPTTMIVKATSTCFAAALPMHEDDPSRHESALVFTMQ